MKIVASPGEIEIQFSSLGDLEIHVQNLQVMLDHNKSHKRGETAHLSYIIAPGSDDYHKKFKLIETDGTSSTVECRKCLRRFVTDPTIEENVISLRRDMERAPILYVLCPQCGNVNI